MVDAAFFLKRIQHLQGRMTPMEAARRLQEMAFEHLNDQTGLRVARLYRIFVYDAPPAAWKGHSPVTKTAVDLSRTPTALWRSEFHKQLRGKRKVALRLGEVPVQRVNWIMKPPAMKDFLNGKWSGLEKVDTSLMGYKVPRGGFHGREETKDIQQTVQG